MAIELTWTGKDEAIAESQSSPEGFVDFRGVDFVSDNIYVEGDNLNVLKTMRHYVPPGMDGGKEFDPHPFVDMIYIDPPYNTGGKSFVYNDRYASEGWLSMMYPRLALAKEILKPEGVIFVSIDKNEVDYLKVVMDEIFGRKNFMIPFVWRKKSGGGNDTTAGYTTHEYILTYGGGGKVKKFRVPLEPHQLEAYGNWDSDPRGDYKLESWKLRRGHYEPRLNRRYTIKHPTDGREVNEKWSGSQEEYEALVADNRIYWPSGRSLPNEKKFLSERVEEGITPTSIIDHSSFMTMSGRKDLIALELAAEAVGGHRRLYFDFPKPVSLITYLLQLAGEDATVMDFFAGSCTTAQAVLEANALDNGTRNFIMVQRPDVLPDDAPARKDIGCETICDVGQERIRRVMYQLESAPLLFGALPNELHILKEV